MMIRSDANGDFIRIRKQCRTEQWKSILGQAVRAILDAKSRPRYELGGLQIYTFLCARFISEYC